MNAQPETEEPARIGVIAEDLGTGHTESVVIADDYVLICAGSCYLAGVEADLETGTHVITVKGVKRSETAATREAG
jgi:hypothetical protein